MQKIEISQHFLAKTNNLPLVEKLFMLARYLGENELAGHINNYINTEKTYKQMGDQLSEAGFKIPSSEDVVSFFKNKILNIYHNDCHCHSDFVNWLK